MKIYLLPKKTKVHVLLWDDNFLNLGRCKVESEDYGGPATLAVTTKDFYFHEDMIVPFGIRWFCDFDIEYKYVHPKSQKTFYRMFFYSKDVNKI